MSQPPTMPPPPPAGGYPPAAAPQQNGMAIAGMVLGIASLALFWLSYIATVIGVVGLILSIIGLNKSKTMGGVGRGMAMAGIITSSLGIVASIVITIVAIQKQNELENELEEIFGQVLLVPALLRFRRR